MRACFMNTTSLMLIYQSIVVKIDLNYPNMYMIVIPILEKQKGELKRISLCLNKTAYILL